MQPTGPSQPIRAVARLYAVVTVRKESAVSSSLRPTLRISLAVLAFGLSGVTLAATSSRASADVRIRIGGGGHIRFGHWHRPTYHYQGPSVRIGGAIWLGGSYYSGDGQGFAQPPPPPPPACDCGTGYYPPIAPAPTAYAVAPLMAPPPPLPRFGIGAYLGGVAVQGVNEGQDVGLVGQFRLGRSLLVDGEIAKNTLASGDRVDRRLMAGLTYELAANRRLSPYISGGLGVTQVDVGGGSYQDSQSLAELGGGVRWRMTDRLSLFGDLRFGARQSIDSNAASDPKPMDTGLAKVMPQSDEKYSRMRLGAMLTF